MMNVLWTRTVAHTANQLHHTRLMYMMNSKSNCVQQAVEIIVKTAIYYW